MNKLIEKILIYLLKKPCVKAALKEIIHPTTKESVQEYQQTLSKSRAQQMKERILHLRVREHSAAREVPAQDREQFQCAAQAIIQEVAR